jgi:hypothetical protein
VAAVAVQAWLGHMVYLLICTVEGRYVSFSALDHGRPPNSSLA